MRATLDFDNLILVLVLVKAPEWFVGIVNFPVHNCAVGVGFLIARVAILNRDIVDVATLITIRIFFILTCSSSSNISLQIARLINQVTLKRAVGIFIFWIFRSIKKIRVRPLLFNVIRYLLLSSIVHFSIFFKFKFAIDLILWSTFDTFSFLNKDYSHVKFHGLWWSVNFVFNDGLLRGLNIKTALDWISCRLKFFLCRYQSRISCDIPLILFFNLSFDFFYGVC